MNNETKKQKGRPKGAKSLVNVTLRQLVDLFPLDAAIPVGSIFLRDYGVSVQSAAPIIVQEAAPEPQEEERIQFTMTDFREQLPDPPAEIYVDAE